jgi:hypothetical protein
VEENGLTPPVCDALGDIRPLQEFGILRILAEKVEPETVGTHVRGKVAVTGERGSTGIGPSALLLMRGPDGPGATGICARRTGKIDLASVRRESDTHFEAAR